MGSAREFKKAPDDRAAEVQERAEVRGKPRQSNQQVARLAVQRRAAPAQGLRAFETAKAPARGGPGGSEGLPFGSQIQAAFGRHDIASVRTQTGGAAAAANDGLGARAYAFGDRIGFREAPDLHTAAHEAAHVVQQKSGVALAGGVGAANDAYEQHADRVADLVVGGHSAEQALSEMPKGGGENAAVQREENVEEVEVPTVTEGSWSFTLVGVDFQCTGTTGGQSGKGGWVHKTSTKTDPKAKKAEEEGWVRLDALWQAEHGNVGTPPAAPGTDVETDTGSGGLFDFSDIPNPLNVIRDGISAIGDAFDSTWTWFFGDGEKSADETKTEEPAETDEAKELAERAKKREELLEGGKLDNLDVAKDLADGEGKFEVPHNYDPAGKGIEGDPTKGDRRDEILAGDKDELKSINCGEFTSMVLVDAGWDLSQEYIDPASNLPVAYTDKYGELAFVTLYMVANIFWEATAALLGAQDETAEKVEEGSERAEALGAPGRSFWYSDSSAFFENPDLTDDNAEAVEHKDSHQFGAGSVAIALGGIEVDSKDRKPGDLQQRLALDGDGEFAGPGHSSQIWSIEGTGVAELGATGSPEIKGDAGKDLVGWHAITGGARMIIGPDTDPSKVAAVETTEFQLIDANQVNSRNSEGEKRTGDAIDIGQFKSDDANAAYSIGRLPTSQWIAWAPTEPELKGTLE